MNAPDVRIERLARRIRRRDVLRAALASAAVGAVGFAAAHLLDASLGTALAAAGAAALVAGLVGAMRLRRRPVTYEATAAWLDRLHPSLEESAALLLRPPADGDVVARMQRARTAAAWAKLPDPAPPRRGLPLAAAGFAAAAALALAAVAVPRPPGGADTPVLRAAVRTAPGTPAPRVERVRVRIAPPAYTGAPDEVADGLDVSALAGSEVQWTVRLTDADDAALVFGAADTLRLRRVGAGRFEGARTVSRSSLYHLAVRGGGGTHRTDDHRLAVAEDRPPVLAVVRPDDRTVLSPGDPMRLPVEVLADDDVGLRDADLVATLAKGTGEAVTFDARTLPFASVERASARSWTLRTVLALDSLGLAPGDVLYVHARARDGRAPEPGVGRSETFFVTLRDTARPDLALDAAFGVSTVPAYFRSQRQIIIDTERLVAERDAVPPDTFRQRAERLGVDQKILRLRYGQFLGEEFESGVTPPPDLPGDAHGDDAHADDHADGGPPPGGFGTGARATAEAYGHMHDSAEGATFYADDIEAALKAALAQMWEAELRLRTLRPAEALPYEYAALRMIKDLQAQTRIYVQRVGFEPPPLRPDERRLTGDLAGIEDRRRATDRRAPPSAPALRAALPLLAALRAGEAVDPAAAGVLREAGGAWAADALETPGRDLSVLADLRALVDALDGGAAPCRACAARAHRALWAALPPADTLPAPGGAVPDDLARRYFDALDGDAPRP